MQIELSKLNTRLKNLQEQILNEVINIDKELYQRVENPHDALYDYELEIEISFYLKEDDLSYIKDEDNILTVITESVKGISLKEDKYPYTLNVNHNEFKNWQHPMKDEFHCWWYHCLYDHNNLSWDELKRIGTICSDIKIVHQYFN